MLLEVPTTEESLLLLLLLLLFLLLLPLLGSWLAASVATSIEEFSLPPPFPAEVAVALLLLFTAEAVAVWGKVRRERRSSLTAMASQISGESREKLLSYSWIDPS